jgi:hypothetical protein
LDYLSLTSPSTTSPTKGPALIALGLLVLMLSAWCPALPVVTAMAILTLGATYVMVQRFRSSSDYIPVLLLHASTYAALYGLFIAATLHAAGRAPNTAVSSVVILDIAASVLPILTALRHIAAAARRV